MAAILAASACTPEKKSVHAEQREVFIASLGDSIKAYGDSIKVSQARLDALNAEVGEMLSGFDYVENPREVEGYYILKGWSGRHPAGATWIYARISKDEDLELIAQLKGGTFDRIAVSSGDSRVESETVPNDQALNFRHSGYTTVCFASGAADTVARFVADHSGDPLTLIYLNPSATGTLKLTPDQINMLTATWRLYSARREVGRLEKQIPAYSRRIDICRRMMAREDSAAE